MEQEQKTEDGRQMTDEYQKLQAEICGYLIGASVMAVSVCVRWASDIAAMAMKRRVRTEFGQILAGLKARGMITQADVDRLERDGMKEVSLG